MGPDTARMKHHDDGKNGRRILVVGPALAGSGYPNAQNTTRLLAELPGVETTDRACWLPADFHLWKMARGSVWQKLRGLWLLTTRSLSSLWHLAHKSHHHDYVYLPYPSLPVLWTISLLPSHWQPRCIADAYITLWDTLFQDRQLGKPQGLASRLLLLAESRALRAAHRIVVDTQANADHLAQLFSVPRDRICAFPLALDPSTLPRHAPLATTPSQRIRVLFIGTFVPLQGTTVIAEAIDLIGPHAAIDFVVIGDGQQADATASLLMQQANVTWKRGWQPPEVLAEELARADICLGVFGGNEKAARVLPFKLYMALAAGKAILTQHDYSVPDGCPPPPLLTCMPTPDALAGAIQQLATGHGHRHRLAAQAQPYYNAHLSATALADCWHSLLSK